MTQEKAEALGWTFNADGTTVEKGREIYMMPSKEMALKIIEKREQAAARKRLINIQMQMELMEEQEDRDNERFDSNHTSELASRWAE